MVVDMGAGALPIRPLPSGATPSGVSHDSNVLKEHHTGDNGAQGPADAPVEQPTPSQEVGAGPEYIDTDDEDDTYRLVINPEKPRKITEKKRLDSAALKEWVSKNQREVTRASAAALNDPNHQSVAHLIKTSENRKIIATPREYQVELFERAKKKNTIVVLPTGTFSALRRAIS